MVITGCATSTRTVFVTSPFDRYDHNRTRELVTPSTCATTNIVKTQAYSPSGSHFFPKAQLQGASTSDPLPAANLVPIFTGIPLPLSGVKEASGTSDRDDLLDFLVRPLHAGIENPGGAADLQEAARRFKPVLDFLADPESLCSTNRQQMLNRLLSQRIVGARRDIADKVVDARYITANAFRDEIAFRVGSFWFIICKWKDSPGYSRLVVISEEVTGSVLKSSPML